MYKELCDVIYSQTLFKVRNCMKEISRYSVVSITTSYGLDGQGVGPGMVKNFLHVVQTGSGAHPASYPVGTEGSFPGGKAAGA
jgi:hypothetical protein